jgi:hypothetical protein
MRIQNITTYDSLDISKLQVLIFLSHIQNHGIPEELVNGIHNAAARFFDLPEEEKMKYYIGNSQVTVFQHSTGSRDISVC